MLVNASANNLEAVQAVSHMLYICTYLYVLCTEYLFNSICCACWYVYFILLYHSQYINMYIYIHVNLKVYSNY